MYTPTFTNMLLMFAYLYYMQSCMMELPWVVASNFANICMMELPWVVASNFANIFLKLGSLEVRWWPFNWRLLFKYYSVCYPTNGVFHSFMPLLDDTFLWLLSRNWALFSQFCTKRDVVISTGPILYLLSTSLLNDRGLLVVQFVGHVNFTSLVKVQLLPLGILLLLVVVKVQIPELSIAYLVIPSSICPSPIPFI